MLYLSLQSILNPMENHSATEIWSENKKIQSHQKKKPLQLSSNCYEGGYSRRAHSISEHTQPPLYYWFGFYFYFFSQWSKRKPWNTIITSISRRNTKNQVVLFPSGTSHFTSKNLLVSLMLPLRFWRDLVLENYTEDLASKTLGQPGVLYDS